MAKASRKIPKTFAYQNFARCDAKKIKENGGKLTIIEEAKKSVIQDVVYRQMPLAKKSNKILRENWKI
ncbi:hypothetical protein UBN96_12090 [Helicobacter pylori]